VTSLEHGRLLGEDGITGDPEGLVERNIHARNPTMVRHPSIYRGFAKPGTPPQQKISSCLYAGVERAPLATVTL
jgi:hypothetical protein